MRLLKQSSTAQPLMFLMIDSTDHVTGKTGLSPTVTLSKSGAAFGSPAGAVTEVANGWYKVAGNATDTGTLGPLVLHATGTGADPMDVEYSVVAFDPQDATRLGMSSIPAALVSGRMDSSVGAMAANVLTATAIASDAITDAKVASDVTIASVTGEVGSVTGAVGSVTGNVGGNVVGSVASVTADVGITQAGADKVWSTAARSLTTFGTLVTDIWAYATRTLTAISDSSGVTTLLSRIGSALTITGGKVDVTDSDSSGVTTLLSRIGSALTITSGKVDVNDKTEFAITSAYDRAKTALAASEYVPDPTFRTDQELIDLELVQRAAAAENPTPMNKAAVAATRWELAARGLPIT